MKELMASRDAHWLPRVVSDNQSVAAPVVTPNRAVAAPKPASESKFLPGPVINGKPTAMAYALRRIQQGHLLQQELRQWGAPLLSDPAC